MKLSGRKIMKAFVLWAFVLFLMPTLSFAREFPTKPINITCAYSPGDLVDVLIRLLAGSAEKILGQPIVIINKPGGAGSIALGLVAKQKPDGYNLVTHVDQGLTRVPQLRKVDFKTEDFVVVMRYCHSPTGLVVVSSSPWKKLKDAVEYAREHPGKFTYSTSGPASATHLSMVFISRQEKIKWTHVPYPGGKPALAAVLGGHVDANSGSTAWVPHVRAGKLRLLATNGKQRMKAFPDVPTLRELGYDFVIDTSYIIDAPKGTPLPIIKKLDDAFRKAMDDPKFVETVKKVEHELSYMSHEDLATWPKEDKERFRKMIIDFNIPTEFDKK
jgi:tripartite-type tricarboxylate transporter receptor subunit TctC